LRTDSFVQNAVSGGCFALANIPKIMSGNRLSGRASYWHRTDAYRSASSDRQLTRQRGEAAGGKKAVRHKITMSGLLAFAAWHFWYSM
jgi:hypothetical protein